MVATSFWNAFTRSFAADLKDHVDVMNVGLIIFSKVSRRLRGTGDETFRMPRGVCSDMFKQGAPHGRGVHHVESPKVDVEPLEADNHSKKMLNHSR